VAQLLRSGGYRQNELEVAVASTIPVTWIGGEQKELVDRLAVYCKPATPTALGSTNPTSRIGFL